jgi:uncharacterized protein involved in outer membrane biogenesis
MGGALSEVSIENPGMRFGLRAIHNEKWARRALWLAAGLVVVWALGWLLVPPLLKSQAQKIATQALGRQVHIGRVDFLPWTLELAVHDVEIASADGKSPQARVKRLYIDGELASLLRLAPVVDAVVVDEPWLALAYQGNGSYDIDDILARLRAAPGEVGSEPLRFAFYNLALNGGAVDFTDRTEGKAHVLRELQVRVPFLSNLPSQREVKVEPRLAFVLNGSRFDSAARGTPFAQTGKTDATLRIARLNLAPYLRYIPAGAPIKLRAAIVNADLRLAFEQSPRMALKLSGGVEVTAAEAADAHGDAVLGFDTLNVALADVRPLERDIHLSSLDLVGLWAKARRDRHGRLNLEWTGGSESADKAQPAAAADRAAPSPWKLRLDQLALRDGQISWDDAHTAAPARLALRELAVEASALAYPMVQPLVFKGSAVATGPAPKSPAQQIARGIGRTESPKLPEQATVRFSGRATDREANATASVSGFALAWVQPYLAEVMRPTLTGSLATEIQLDWKAPAQDAKPGEPLQLTLQVPQLRLDQLVLRDAGQTWVAANQILMTGTRVDMARQSAAIGKLTLRQPSARLARGADRRWMFSDWPAPVGAVIDPPVDPARTEASPPWALSLQELAVEQGAVSLQDAAAARPVAVALSALQLQMKEIAPRSGQPSPLTLSARIGGAQGEPGSLAYQGSLNLAALSAQGAVQAQRMPIHAFEPYFADLVNIELLRADASFTGRMFYAQGADGATVRVSGNGAVEDFRANTLPGPSGGLGGGEELLSWKALSLRGLDFAMAPRKASSVEVQETVLSDFFSRLIVHENGRINLQDLLKPPAVAEAAAAASAPASAVVSAVGSAPGESGAMVRFGPVSLLNGKVHFSDRFVKPSYSADLSELTGKLSAFSSTPAQGTPQMADLELRGRAEGTASLEILGKLNPLAKPLALDIRGKVRDLELPALSPYAIKYAGHGIERGKLSLDVAYRVLPDGQLTASNNLVLHQLVFGEKVEGAPNSLPVKLAVALLADRNGVIDLDLPVSGSLNDPQFSLGPVIFKLIFNLIAKAITSPFALLASAIGSGAEELGTVAFAPGSAVLAPSSRDSLEKVAKALTERPALKMTVVGTASLDVEREAYRRERLRALVLAEKRRATVLAGTTGTGQTATATIAIADAEYPSLLREVYKRADMPKPRNLIGMTKDLPQAEMEALLLVQIPVNEEAMRELAVQRGVAVRDYLAAQQIAAERLFLGAAKAVPPDAKWTPHAELNLAIP